MFHRWTRGVPDSTAADHAWAPPAVPQRPGGSAPRRWGLFL